MAVASEVVARRYIDVASGTPISVDIPAYEAGDVYVYYGGASLTAVQGTDYTVALAGDFNTFTITPQSALIDKINALIASDATEVNAITVRRWLDSTTEATAAGVRYTPFTSKEFDRNAMRDAQLMERLNRAVVLGPRFLGDAPQLQLDETGADKVLMFNADGTAIVAGPTAAQVEAAQGYAVRAETAANSTTISYQTIAAMLAETDALTVDTYVIGGGHRYKVVASGGDLVTAYNRFEVQALAGWYLFDAFNPNRNGTDSDAAKLQAMVDRASGSPMFVSAGTYLIDTAISMRSGTGSTFNAGPRLHGAGEGRTIFANALSSAAMFEVDAGGVAGTNFLMGAELVGFKIIKSGTPTAQIAISLDTSYMTNIQNVHIDGMAGTGIRIPCAVGDNDGSNMVSMKHVRIENCTTWGIDAAGDAGFNETSFIYMEHVFIQACGTDDGAYQPPSGGMKWKGQILTMMQCAFTLNENCAFWVPGEAGLAQSAMLRDTTFENNNKRAIFCRGIKAFKGRNLQFYSNDNFTMTNAVEFEAASYTVAGVDIKGVVVRATSGNSSYTAFKISGSNAELETCKIEDVLYDEWGHAGQVKQSGFENDPVVDAKKTSAQVLVSSMSAVVFNVENADNQSRYNPTNGRYTISHPRWMNFKGHITLTSLTAGDVVEIELYGVNEAAALAKVVHVAGGATDQSFSFDFTAQVGSAGTTRDYEVRAKQSHAGGSRNLNVSDGLNNVVHISPVTMGEI